MAGKRKNGEGTYGKKAINGKTYVFFRDSSGDYTYAKTATELQQKISQKKDQRKETVTTIPKLNLHYTFGDYCMVWLKQKANDITERVYDDYENIIINRIQKFTGYDLTNKQIRTLIPDIFTTYFAVAASQYSRGSLQKTWTVIRQVLKYGMTVDRLIPTFELELIRLPREKDVAVKKKEVPFITEGDMELLYQESQKPVYADGAKVIAFIMYSGLRISEATALKWKYVAQDMQSIVIREAETKIVVRDSEGNPVLNEDGTRKLKKVIKDPKTESGARTIPLPNRGTEILQFFDRKFPDHTGEDFVFLTDNQTRFDRRRLERLLNSMQANAHCSRTDYTVHSLRHGYGSILISKGVDIKIVSELLGHSDVTTTYNIYIGVLKEDKINAVRGVFK